MIQKPMFSPQVEWLPPEEFKDLSGYEEIAIDLETKDPDLKTMGSGSVTGRAEIVGIALSSLDLLSYFYINIYRRISQRFLERTRDYFLK